MTDGKVFLVGAGPGDPGLLTVKGLRCLREAEVVVYDRLASDKLLEEVPPGAELIYVGKRPDRHTMPQEEINRLLVDRARQGLRVVRLKGGDPYVFGRGGEEAETLHDAGVAFEVVPGITSAVAVPGYAGIPVTHRDYASSFAVVTGHERPDRDESALNWEHLARATDTLIFLMGVGNLPSIVQNLLEHGRPGGTPVALIRWGTRAEQHTVTGTLDTIVDRVERAGLRPPAIIVVGGVVGLREKLDWFEKRPLFGRRVVVTRARTQASRMTVGLEALGAEVLELPLIEILPPTAAEQDRLTRALAAISDFSWVVFTSANAVRSVFSTLGSTGLDIRRWAQVKVAAVGSATARELAGHGVAADFVPDQYNSDAVLEGLKPRLGARARVLLPRSDLAPRDLPDGLEAAGASVVAVTAYHTVARTDRADELVRRLEERSVDAVTFTSSSTARNFVDALQAGYRSIHGRAASRDELLALLEGVFVASIGPKTSATARGLGMEVSAEAGEASIQSLVETVRNGCRRD